MSKQTEALKLALEWDKRRKYIMPYVVRDAIREALAEQPAIKQDLTPEQPAQQPNEADEYVQKVIDALYENSDPVSVEAAELLEQMTQQQEPVAWARNLTDPQPHCVTDLKYMSVADTDAGVQYTPLYTSTQAQRTWVGLTVDEIEECYSDTGYIFARAIEAKLKEKNNG